MSPRYMDLYGPLPPPPPPLDLAGGGGIGGGGGRPISPPLPLSVSDVLEDDNSMVVGLRVYTQKSAPTLISGKLKNPGNG